MKATLGRSGVRDLAQIDAAEAATLGQEAADLHQLAAAGLPVARGWAVRLAGDHPEERLVDTIERALASVGVGSEAPEGSSEASPPGRVDRVRLRTLFPTENAAARFERRAGLVGDVTEATDVPAFVAEFLDTLRAPELAAALGGSLMGLHVRVLVFDGALAGTLASADAQSGDPDKLLVTCHGAAAAPFHIDRRSMRITSDGEGLDADAAERLADLADRAQLELGRPLRLEWGMNAGRHVLTGVRTLAFRPLPQSPWRRVALMVADEGAVCPLAVDALDRALGTGEPGPHVERAVKRVFARPYRRLQTGSTLGGARTSVARAGAQAARAAKASAFYIADAKRYERLHPARLIELDAVDLARVSDEGLLDAMRRRQRLTAECLLLLDRGRVTTLAVLEALEMTLGPLPRECYGALATPRRTRARRRSLEQLARFAKRLDGELRATGPREALSPSLGREWDRLRASVSGLRALGIDVWPSPFGESDETFQAQLQHMLRVDLDSQERARKDAMRRLAATARGRDMGRAREGLVTSLGGMAERVAVTKGVVAEELAASLLRLRAGALEVGRRLVEGAILDVPSDALYLTLAELEEALHGEPGAYASRVRLRREDDARWSRFEAPRRA